jgi:hypothetical protein
MPHMSLRTRGSCGQRLQSRRDSGVLTARRTAPPGDPVAPRRCSGGAGGRLARPLRARTPTHLRARDDRPNRTRLLEVPRTRKEHSSPNLIRVSCADFTWDVADSSRYGPAKPSRAGPASVRQLHPPDRGTDSGRRLGGRHQNAHRTCRVIETRNAAGDRLARARLYESVGARGRLQGSWPFILGLGTTPSCCGVDRHPPSRRKDG